MGIFILFLLIFLLIYSVFSIQYRYAAALESMLMLTMALIIFILGHISLRNKEVFLSDEVLPDGDKYKNSPLTQQQLKDNSDRLKEFMKNSKPYLNPDLKLQDISDQLSIPRHHLSQIINQELQLIFFDFVNHHRIEQAKKSLTDPKLKHLSIHGIALDSGFRNKPSFNRIFKKHTKMTPSEYIKSLAK